VDVFQNLPVPRIGLGQTLHVVDELTGHGLASGLAPCPCARRRRKRRSFRENMKLM